MVKLHAYQQQFANMVFVLAAILTLTFDIPIEVRIFIILSLVGVVVLSNRRGIRITGMVLGMASMSFAIMFFFGNSPSNPVHVIEAYTKTLIAVIYTLILFGSVLHLMHE